MERVKNSGRKPHFCPDCYDVANKERHKKRQKERDRSYVHKKERAYGEEKMVMWLPVEPLIKILKQSHIKDEDWAIATSRDRSLTTYMANRLGLQYTSMSRYLEPGAMVSAYKADEFAIRLRIASYTYLGNGVLPT
jgi:phosphoglycolate phosphatase-like HAD superfamily hydrolase